MTTMKHKAYAVDAAVILEITNEAFVGYGVTLYAPAGMSAEEIAKMSLSDVEVRVYDAFDVVREDPAGFLFKKGNETWYLHWSDVLDRFRQERRRVAYHLSWNADQDGLLKQDPLAEVHES